MGTRYNQGDIVKHGEMLGQVLKVENPKSNSPTYHVNLLHDREHPPEHLKASDIKMADSQRKFAMRRRSLEDKNNITVAYSYNEIENLFPALEGMAENKVSDLEGFRAIAFTPPVKSLYYNEDADIMVSEVEGDITIYKNPTNKEIARKLSYYPKAEVVAEELDPRFDR